jgi:SAM-dependent methyltransferase
LRAEWADILFPGEYEVSSELDSATPDELGGDGCPGRFYRRLGLIMSSWAADLALEPDRICDVGGGTGRTAFEIATRFPQASEIVFVEPSYSFCEWARRLLAGAEFDGWIPLPDKLARPTYRFVVEGSLPKPVPQVRICNATAHVVPRPLAYFDLVSCLNVVDRVDDPARLVADLTGLLRPGGLLVLASPLHFEEQFTSRSRWLGDLRELLDPAYWDVGLRDVNVRYEFLHYRRRMSLYLSQVVGAVLMDK